MAKLTERVLAWEPMVRKYAEPLGVPVDFALSLLQAESAGKPDSVSVVGAKGLMQLTPIAVRDLGEDPRAVDLHDPETNIRLGVTYLAKMLDRFQGNEQLAAAAYNAGPTRVARIGRVPGIRETQDYVGRIERTLAEARGVSGQPAFRFNLGTGSARVELAKTLSDSAILREPAGAGDPVEPRKPGLLGRRGKNRG